MLCKVGSKTNCSSAAGAISQQLREGGDVEVQVIGAGALNQAVKAIIIAKGHLAPLGFDLVCRMNFVNLEIEGNERTGIRISVKNDSSAVVTKKEDQPKLREESKEKLKEGSKEKAEKKEEPGPERKPRKKDKEKIEEKQE